MAGAIVEVFPGGMSFSANYGDGYCEANISP